MSRPKSLVHELAELRTAALRVYYAGRWERVKSPDRRADEKLWEALREALKLPLGTTANLPE